MYILCLCHSGRKRAEVEGEEEVGTRLGLPAFQPPPETLFGLVVLVFLIVGMCCTGARVLVCVGGEMGEGGSAISGAVFTGG